MHGLTYLTICSWINVFFFFVSILVFFLLGLSAIVLGKISFREIHFFFIYYYYFFNEKSYLFLLKLLIFVSVKPCSFLKEEETWLLRMIFVAPSICMFCLLPGLLLSVFLLWNYIQLPSQNWSMPVIGTHADYWE